jgi:uncharacterized protein (DUF2252 family)
MTALPQLGDDARDPFALARRQIALDAEATARFPELGSRKKSRLLTSPFGFLRGSAPLFYEVLARSPDLAAGPDGRGWLVGDMHLENVGAYRTDESKIVFSLNDFDDATIGPWRLDVLRLTTSVLLAGRGFEATGPQAVALAERGIEAYVKGAWGLTGALPVPGPIRALVEEAESRSPKKLLEGRAPVDARGRRHFVRGDRYFDLPQSLSVDVRQLLSTYVTALGSRAPKSASKWGVEDAAMRIAGTGSLGGVRVAVLTRDEEKDGEERILELKEARASACEAFVRAAYGAEIGAFSHEGERVVAAASKLAPACPRLLAPVQGAGLSFVGRKLFPQEDKLDLTAFRAGEKLEGVVEYIGYTLGAGHARAVLSRPANPWTKEERAAILDRAVLLAGLFESIYLAYSRLSG